MTSQNITRINYTYGIDQLGSIEGLDIQASLPRYEDAIRATLEAAFPGAEISVGRHDCDNGGSTSAYERDEEFGEAPASDSALAAIRQAISDAWEAGGWMVELPEVVVEIRDVLEQERDFAIGNGDATAVAREWHEAGFSAREVREWLEARCFEASAAKELRDAGVTSEQSSRRIYVDCGDYGETIGYAVSNGDLTVANVVVANEIERELRRILANLVEKNP